MKILVLNCGSSSIKYQLLDMSNEPVLLAKGIVERIGLEEGILTHKPEGGEKYILKTAIENHTIGINLVLKAMTDGNHGVIEKLEEINAVGHRVAHGGEFFSESSYITPKAKDNIQKCCELAPLHNPANLKGIEAMKALLPEVPQVAVFDTSFHQSMPDYSYHYPIPYEFYDKYKLRRYGFHGTSHKFVAQKACESLGWDITTKKIITCHLGNGASVCAVKNGESVDTSMGFTPVEGLMMGTRVGDFDLGGLLFLMEKENLDIAGANKLINKQSGLQGFSGVSSDMRDLDEAAESGNKRADLAKEMFAYRVKKYIGAYAAAMNGVDLILFTGGIGENDADTRKRVATDLDYLGAKFDESKNACRGKDCNILSTEDSSTKIIVVTTDEELVIARDTKRIVKAL
ncbi:MAG: acetate kinase [Bacteroidales bacterium]|jgi:acetate kinase|nr:acetate kinase [Bacteroidales bacterium]